MRCGSRCGGLSLCWIESKCLDGVVSLILISREETRNVSTFYDGIVGLVSCLSSCFLYLLAYRLLFVVWNHYHNHMI